MFESEYLQNELVDEFQMLSTSDQQNRQGNTLINMIKNLTTTSKQKSSQQGGGSGGGGGKLPLVSSQPSVPVVLSTAPPAASGGNKVRPESFAAASVPPQQPRVSIGGGGAAASKKSPDETSSSGVSSQIVFGLGELQPLPDLRLDEPKLIEQAMSGIKPVEHYLNMSHEDYLQHKSPILQCKFSNDGKYVASVDSQGFIKSTGSFNY